MDLIGIVAAGLPDIDYGDYVLTLPNPTSNDPRLSSHSGAQTGLQGHFEAVLRSETSLPPQQTAHEKRRTSAHDMFSLCVYVSM